MNERDSRQGIELTDAQADLFARAPEMEEEIEKLKAENWKLRQMNDTMARKLVDIVEICGIVFGGDALSRIKEVAFRDGLQTPILLLDELCAIFGWQGGTIHDALREVQRLKDQERGMCEIRKERP